MAPTKEVGGEERGGRENVFVLTVGEAEVGVFLQCSLPWFEAGSLTKPGASKFPLCWPVGQPWDLPVSARAGPKLQSQACTIQA